MGKKKCFLLCVNHRAIMSLYFKRVLLWMGTYIDLSLFMQLKAVAEHFLKQKKRVLVVGSWPISLGHIRRHDQNSLPSVMDFLRVHCGVFCLAAR